MRTLNPLTISTIDPEIIEFLTAFQKAGGRGVLVGGLIRDLLLGVESKDYDIEIFGLTMDQLEEILTPFGEVIAVGKSFGVLRVKGYDIDFSIPRRDNKIGKGHRGFRMEFDPQMSFTDAARRRDLRLNSISWDPLADELIDPFEGIQDLKQERLRATDSNTFSEDPLRGLRVAQFAARLEMQPDDELMKLCSELDLSDLSGERLWGEFHKLLLKAKAPSIGFEVMRVTGMLKYFPELLAMVGVPQDPLWHPEGTVWEHTLMVVDEAAKARTGDVNDDLVLMYSALCHDLGKPATTFTDDEGRIRSPNHEPEGVAPTVEFLERLRAPNFLVEQVSVIVRYHLAPAQYIQGGATAKAYRRLARKFSQAGSNLQMLYRLARADHFGRTTPDALAREFPAGEAFLKAAMDLNVEESSDPDVVLGRHLIQRGYKPGPEFGPILDRCREIQDETGWTDSDQILEAYFKDPTPQSGE